MEQEYFLSGYCRTTDGSRTVTVEIKDDKLAEVDCCFAVCVHAPNCTIARQVRTLLADCETHNP